MLSQLADLEGWWGPLRVFRYLTFRALGGAATGFLLGLIVGPWVIRRLRAWKLAQAQRGSAVMGDLAKHFEGKRGTPSMGGFIIAIAFICGSLLWARPNVWVLVALAVYAGLAAVGFLDDWLKISRKNTAGLQARAKLVAQTALTAGVLAVLWNHPTSAPHARELWLPFLKEPVWTTMPAIAAAILLFFVLVGSSNAINLTDGLDGLAIGCTITVALVFGIMAYAAGHARIADYLFISYVPGAGELAVVCSTLVGAGLAFLWFNAHPAEVFMGDTGSLALGGLVGVVAYLIHQPFTLVIVGGIFVVEALSVLLQVGWFKATGGRRLFLMAPIHHHFQKLGWPETKVVVRFWVLSLVCALAGLGTLKLR